MNYITALATFLSFMMHGYIFAQAAPGVVSVKEISDSEVSVKTKGFEHPCRIDRQVVGVKMSSDKGAVIISGTSYVPVAKLERCDSNVAIHATKAAPHVGFLTDVNLKTGIYTSLIPISVNPMGFVAVVAKVGSDRNLVNFPGFYRSGVKQSTLLSEASADMSPTLSVDARYVSLYLHTCESEGYEQAIVIEIRSGKKIGLNRAMCEREFHFE